MPLRTITVPFEFNQYIKVLTRKGHSIHVYFYNQRTPPSMMITLCLEHPNHRNEIQSAAFLVVGTQLTKREPFPHQLVSILRQTTEFDLFNNGSK